jgi:hypothetical protein
LRARTEVFLLVCTLCRHRSNALHEAKLVPTVESRTPQKAGAAHVAGRWESGPWACGLLPTCVAERVGGCGCGMIGRFVMALGIILGVRVLAG